jgi:hypothetical protein
MAACWVGWRRQQAVIEQHAVVWRDRLVLAGRLTDKLVDFVENKLECWVFSNP